VKKPPITVSDHAVLRYLEQVYGLNVTRIRREIGHVVANGVERGADGVQRGSVTYKLKGRVVTTVISRSPHRKLKKARDA
jgi:hypothetical protein